MSFVSPVVAALVVSASVVLAVADDVPAFNLSPSCRAETASAASDRSCLSDEQRARDTLESQWSRFAPADKANCVQVEQTAGAPSYVELLTCLQMAQAAKKLPAD